MLNDQARIPTLAYWFNLLGWIGFIFVVFFNFSVIIITIVDFIRMCKVGNTLHQMDEIRRDYYWEKVKKYED